MAIRAACVRNWPGVLLVLLILFSPTVAGATNPAAAERLSGGIVPAGPLHGRGDLTLSNARQSPVAWSPAESAAAPFELGRVGVTISEWRWQSTAPAESSSGPRAGIASHEEQAFEVLNALVRTVGGESEGRWELRSAAASPAVVLGDLSDCAIRPELKAAQPPVPGRPGASAPQLVAGTAVLQVSCADGSVLVVASPGQRFQLVANDMDVEVRGIAEDSAGDMVKLLRAGTFSRQNASNPAIYDNVYRTVSFERVVAGDVPEIVDFGSGGGIRIATPAFQWTGQMEVPAFAGTLRLGDAAHVDSSSGMALVGSFIGVANGTGRVSGIDLMGVAAQTTEAEAVASGSPMGLPWVLAAAGGTTALFGMRRIARWFRHVAPAVMAPLFSRISRHKTLDHPVRRAIVDLVREDPGIRLHEAYAALGVGRGTILHHLAFLERDGLVVVRRSNRRVMLFPTEGSPELDDEPAALLRKPVARRLLSLVARRRQVTQVQIARTLGLSQSYVSELVRRLEAADLIGRTRVGRHTVYSVRPDSDA